MHVVPVAARMSAVIVWVVVLALVGTAQTGAAAAAIGRVVLQDDDVSAAIVGGSDAPLGRYPYAVSLRQRSGLQLHFCGGSLVHRRFVLTAAHCFFTEDGKPAGHSFRSPLLRIGGYIKYGPDPGHESRRAAMVRHHPQFRPGTNENDAALILLDHPSAKQPIGLPPASAAPAARPGDVLTAIGWGLLRQGGPTATVLQQVGLKLRGNSVCRRYMPGERWGRNSFMCAGEPGSGRDTCAGDSGSPLLRRTTKRKGRDLQVGITSWGYACAGSRPAVYTNVARMAPWIKATMRAMLKAQRRRQARQRRGLLAALQGARSAGLEPLANATALAE